VIHFGKTREKLPYKASICPVARGQKWKFAEMIGCDHYFRLFSARAKKVVDNSEKR
jgi:hypothetical protein